MGGDYAPQAPVAGSLLAVQKNPDIEVVLVGKEPDIEEHLGSHRNHPRIRIVPASEVIEMTDVPVQAIRKKTDSSMVRAMHFLKEGQAEAVISAGNTGALMASGLFIVGRMPEIERPALTAVMPVFQGWGLLLLDVGANLDPKPTQLFQYALMGSLYCREVYGISEPRVALLNVGEEAGKGPPLVREAYELLDQSELNFVGNVESRELLQGHADVVVCDGFSGNMVLKLTEGLARDIMAEFKAILMKNFQTKLAAMVLREGLTTLKNRLDYQEYGGAPLLGLDRMVYKCHGSSQSRAFEKAVQVAHHYGTQGTQERIRQYFVGGK